MSKISLQPNASGTGTFTLAAPNSNTNRTLSLPDEAGTVLTSAGVPVTAMPTGSVIQVVQGTKLSSYSVSLAATTEDTQDVPGYSVDITPLFSSSKILVMVNASINGIYASYSLKANGTKIFLGTGGSSFNSTSDGLATAIVLHEPASTSQQTYTIRLRNDAGSTRTTSVNGSGDTGYSSTITAMEIAV